MTQHDLGPFKITYNITNIKITRQLMLYGIVIWSNPASFN